MKKRKQTKSTNKSNMDMILAAAVQDSKVPILSLDPRWHDLFPPEEKTEELIRLEDDLNQVMKEQGRLVNELKDLKRAKKKLMDEIVAGMDHLPEKKKKQNQRLILEMNERIENDTDRVLELPEEIRKANERLLTAGVQLCYRKLSTSDERRETVRKEISELQEILERKEIEKERLDTEHNRIYSYMHNLLGPEILELFEKG